MEKLEADVKKAPANFRLFTTPTSTIKMSFFLKALVDLLQISLSETVRMMVD